MNNEELKFQELTDEELAKVTGGTMGDVSPKYSCRAEIAATNVTVGDHIRRILDDDLFECDGYANSSNQTIWTFHNLDNTTENLMFVADSVNYIIYGFRR